MDEDASPPRKSDDGTIISILIAIGLVVLGLIYLPEILPDFFGSGVRTIVASPTMQATHAIALAMYCYAVDHHNAYPAGKSSTGVFQELLDEGYVTDPALFYLDLPGKTKATTTKLKPENVCFDVTVSLDDKDPDALPLVFTTGYRLIYAPGGNAVPLKPGSSRFDGMAVAYLNHSAQYIHDNGAPDYVVIGVIDPSFKPTGKTFQQLTPDGFLPTK